jgi:hypothetical protein
VFVRFSEKLAAHSYFVIGDVTWMENEQQKAIIIMHQVIFNRHSPEQTQKTISFASNDTASVWEIPIYPIEEQYYYNPSLF